MVMMANSQPNLDDVQVTVYEGSRLDRLIKSALKAEQTMKIRNNHDNRRAFAKAKRLAEKAILKAKMQALKHQKLPQKPTLITEDSVKDDTIR